MPLKYAVPAFLLGFQWRLSKISKSDEKKQLNDKDVNILLHLAFIENCQSQQLTYPSLTTVAAIL
jgi:hypothetical protein